MPRTCHGLFAAALLLLSVAPAPAVEWEGVGHIATDFHLFSTREYQGFRNAAWGVVVSPEGWRGLGVEVRVQRLWGTIRLAEDQVTAEELGELAARGETPRTSHDHWMVGVVPVWRHSVWGPLELEGGLGLSLLDQQILTEGTRWNVLMMVGARWRFRDESPLAVGVRCEHFSNGGDIGMTDDAAIGLESAALAVSWRF